MRITNNIIQRESLSQMQTSLRAVEKAQRRASTGLRVQTASDDPAAASSAMQTRSSLRALEQYQSNIERASSRSAMEENVLDQVTNLLTRAKELGVSQGGSTSNAATRAAAAAEIRELLEAAVGLGNTRYGEEYLFGGQYTSAAPFAIDQPDFLRDPAQPPEGSAETEIAAGRRLQANHDGKQVFLDTGVLSALNQLASALEDPSGSTEAVGNALTAVDESFDGVQALMGVVGARSNQLEMTEANLSALKINLQTLKSDLEEVDFEEAITELVGRQTSFQAAMLATSKVMGLTLADYLR